MIIETLVANLMLLACIWTGINACWGIFVAVCIRKAVKQRKQLNPIASVAYDNYGAAGIFLMSFILLACLLFGGFMGVSVVIESLLVYNIFHTIFLSAISFQLVSWWVAQTKKAS